MTSPTPTPAGRVTLPQAFVLAVIWAAVAYGVLADEKSQTVEHAEAVRLVACR